MSTNGFKIEKGVPAPGVDSRRTSRRYPFNEMKIGDSFFVPLNGKEPIRVQSNVMSSARTFRKTGAKFTSSISHDPPGVRVWRVE